MPRLFQKKTIIILFLFIFNLFTYANEIIFVTHQIEGKHFIDENNHIRGIPHSGKRAFNIELVREMMKEMNYPIHFEVFPFRRAYVFLTANEKPYALFNIGRRASREDKVKWVGPLQTDDIYFYENTNNPTNIKDFKSAKNVKRICTINGSFHEKLLKKNDFKNVIVSKDYNSCFKMLALKRVDLTMISSHSLYGVLKSSGIDKSLIRNTDVLFSKVEGFMALSKMIDDEVIAKWQKALDNIKESGRYDELVKEYLLSKEK